ncbi:MAG TPA: hypothetical protein VK988_20910 [Acidimicrobiales bacterium]|nr:hypothetical protein [Acidimicrobiales bacterium]
MLGAFGNGTLDSQAGLGEQAPFIATFCAGGAVAAVAKDRCNRARHAAILGRAAGALDETVVSGHQMTGRFRRRTVEVLLDEGGVNEYASMVVVLADCAGRTDWCVVYLRLPGRWRSKGLRASFSEFFSGLGFSAGAKLTKVA